MKTTAPIKVIILSLALVLPALAGEKKIRLEDCPAAVQKTIKDKAAGGKIIEVERETERGGKVVYEAEIRLADGRKVDLEIAEDGTLIEEEED
ncbi:MAG: hypothetical protein AB1705_05410 [Verrucomicrobiota bacterium]